MRPTVLDVLEALRSKGAKVDTTTIFPGPDNEDAPIITRVEHNGKRMHINLPDEAEASPSFVDNVCRRLGLAQEELPIDCPSGTVVSVRSPPERPAN